MGSPVRFGFLVLLLLASSLHGQDLPRKGDYHTLEDEGRRLYSVSAFAHGHRHGYEEGYRLADQEIHFGLRQREIRERDVPSDMDYQGRFGNKQIFRRGFVHGFLAGYRASYANEPFRVPEWLDEVPPLAKMNELPQADSTGGPTKRLRRGFDEGARQGYESGLRAAMSDAGVSALARQAGETCSAAPQAQVDGFCDGFRQGFLLAARDRTPVPAPPAGRAVAQSGVAPQ